MWVNECVYLGTKGLRNIKLLHQILAGVSLKRLQSKATIDGVFGETQAKEKLDYQSIFCCQEPRNTERSEKLPFKTTVHR